MKRSDLASWKPAVPAVVAARTAEVLRAQRRWSLACWLVVASLAGCVPPGSWMGAGTWGWTGFAPTPEAPPLPAPEDPYGEPPPTTSGFAAPLQVHVTGTGGRVTAGEADNGPQWISRALYNAGYSYADIPAFEGTAAEWQFMITCAQNHFAGFPIQLVDTAPTTGDYVTVVVGGQAAHMGQTNMWGWASMGDKAVVVRGMGFVFSQDHGPTQRADLCQTLAHEIGHLVGLDHTQDCGDLMETPRNCERTGFLERSRAALAVSLAPYTHTPTAVTPTSHAIERLTPTFGYWPISIEAEKPLARGLMHVRTPSGYRSEYHCLPGVADCKIVGAHLSGRYPLMEPGVFTMRLELFYLDGEVRMTPWITTAGLSPSP